DSDSRVTPPNNEQKAPSNPKGEVNHSNKASKQHKTDALPETGSENNGSNNATLFGGLFAALGSLLLFGRRKKQNK
ncbi:clumping factor B, partial [Staphylococcus aureus]|uniref:LPXTG cell wall anchor domain-containing protein n=1 Tax=Staphylococcus aureus TaxID=1280 RepID=UPI000DB18A82